ncbi:alpha/beta hydrolase [Mycolicibacterium smegmatis]|uniref:Alpha/beta hydrolase fold n=1 Tax=Mycolicibacterium smegmatis (strain MKD8) TaxID=1214915 RepID=A0A2U9PXG2_MYCSE|nr:alpha/beta fold hydrolase [Mycolicibacterium smegmatis]AWT56491.1 alpha/beta hydrolase fold [Mycolicibacterium smegmatis MKD8]
MRAANRLAVAATFLAVMFATACEARSGESTGELSRTDTRVGSAPGVEVAVRALRTESADRVPVILLHGARVPGIASFDLPVPGYSLAEDLVRAGHPTFIMDARGYGGSSRPAEMDGDPGTGRPLVRSNEVVEDIHAVVEHVAATTGAERVALVGWATGGHWAGMYAATHPDRVSHLVIYNSLYGAADGHPTLAVFDPESGPYRLSDGPSLLTSWDRSIPASDVTLWRDPRVAEAYQREALASDPTSESRTPASFRAPNGAMEDSHYLATGRQLWDASLITAETLIIRSELDFWSRPEDVEDMRRHLVHAAGVRTVVLPQATHYVHLDRPERGRDQFLGALLDFLP